MRIRPRFFYSMTCLLNLLLMPGCGSNQEPQAVERGPKTRHDDWRIMGRLATPGFSNGEMLAVGMDGTTFRTEIATDNSFGMELPGNSSYAVYFFPPSTYEKPNAVGASDFVDSMKGASLSQDGWALLHFEDSPEFGMRDTLRLPDAIFNHNLNFGEIDIKGNLAFPTLNPASQLDFDGDGINDATDPDDQNDGLNDLDQKNELERVNICHYNSHDKGMMQSIPLSQLLTHMGHGDTIGTCQSFRMPLVEDDGHGAQKSEKNASMPTASLPAMPAKNSKTADPAASPLVNPSVVIEETPDEEEVKEAAAHDEGKDHEDDATMGEDEEESDSQDKEEDKSDDASKDKEDSNDADADKDEHKKRKKKDGKKNKDKDGKKRKERKESDDEQ